MPRAVYVNGERRENSTQEENPGKHQVNKTLYVTLALLLGWCGIHKFYARHFLAGILYLLFSITLIPLVIALFDVFRGCGEIRDEHGRIWV